MDSSRGRKRPPLAIHEARQIDDVGNHARGVAVTREHLAEIFGRHDDLVRQPQPRMHEGAPVGEMVVGLAAVVVQHHALVSARATSIAGSGASRNDQ